MDLFLRFLSVSCGFPWMVFGFPMVFHVSSVFSYRFSIVCFCLKSFDTPSGEICSDNSLRSSMTKSGTFPQMAWLQRLAVFKIHVKSKGGPLVMSKIYQNLVGLGFSFGFCASECCRGKIH